MSELAWTLGFRSHTNGKYLTQETFGFKVNCNGTSLRKKQIFTLEPAADGKVNIKTHLGRYIYGNKDGGFAGDAEKPSNETTWTIEPQSDGTWALKSAYGFYVHGSGDNLTAFVKELPADGKWVIHLAMHPQVNVRNVMRKKFIHLEEGELHCNEPIPWGEDALLTFVFFEEHSEGRYGFISANGKYLSSSGRLVDSPDASCQFLLGFHDNQVSFRDASNNYLTCVGAKGVVKSGKDKITRDELFVLQDSEPQFVIVDTRGKYFSNRTAEEVKADQPDVTDLERFQLELDNNGNAFFKNSNEKYWSLTEGGVISASKTTKGSTETFQLEFHKNRIKLIASNRKYLTVKSNGGIVANGNGSEDSASFIFTLINRPQLILRGQYGFVGLKGGSGRVEVNRSSGDIFSVESKNGAYALKAHNGKYAQLDADGLVANSSTPVNFYFEFVQYSKFLIRAENDKYLQGEQNGGFKAVGTDANLDTLWEY